MRTINTQPHIYVLISLYMPRVFTFNNSVLLSTINSTFDICDDLWMNGLIEWHFMPYESDPTIWLTNKGRWYIENLLIAQADGIAIIHPKPVHVNFPENIERVYREALSIIASSSNLNGIQCAGIADAALCEIEKIKGCTA